MLEPWFGGVRDRVPSAMSICDAGGRERSGDNVAWLACGTEPSKSSARRRVEKVRLASSARQALLLRGCKVQICPEPTLLKVKLALRRALLLLRGRCWGRFVMQQAKAGLKILPGSSGNKAGNTRHISGMILEILQKNERTDRR